MVGETHGLRKWTLDSFRWVPACGLGSQWLPPKGGLLMRVNAVPQKTEAFQLRKGWLSRRSSRGRPKLVLERKDGLFSKWGVGRSGRLQ